MHKLICVGAFYNILRKVIVFSNTPLDGCFHLEINVNKMDFAQQSANETLIYLKVVTL